MGKKSVKENKNIYQLSREEQGFTREQASEAIGFMSDSRIEKIESEKSYPQPDEILAMAEVYKKPSLSNYYCSHECPIGRENVPEIKSSSLSEIVLAMLAELNSFNKIRDRLIDITADGKISDDELPDFLKIQEELDGIALTIDSLNLWIKETVSSGIIDKEKINRLKSI
ncbi:MAG: helix-turn-helix transcriptional regulator [Lachnospiraceae bacterium]|nr:helix-turn-helix transcriptional regulator [Lachnospiraceae bacterium]